MKYRIFIIALALFLAGAGKSLAQSAVQPLHVGDQVPDMEIAGVINYPRKTIKLSDFKGKMVILNFWATWCGACIAELPELDSLQKKFRDDIVILSVTSQPTIPVADFIKQNRNLSGLHLPYVTQDSALRRCFPFRIMGQQVWVDGSGKVVSITDQLQVTEANITNALRGDYASIKQKTPDILEMDGTKPLYSGFFGDTYVPDGNLIQYQSMLTDAIDGAGDRNTGPVLENGRVLTTIVNWRIQHLYQQALMKEKHIVYQYQGDYSERLESRISLEVKDSSYFSLLSFSKSQKEAFKKLPYNLTRFTYQQIIPAKDSLLAKDYMLQDLNRYFGSKLGIEGLRAIRKVKCWALIKTNNYDIRSKPDTAYKATWGRNKDYVVLHNYPFKLWFKDMLMFFLAQSPIPIINESGYKDDKVDMEISADLTDVVALNKALKKYGLEFRLVERNLDMIVIRDKKSL